MSPHPLPDHGRPIIKRTSQGRVATELSYQRLGLKPGGGGIKQVVLAKEGEP